MLACLLNNSTDMLKSLIIEYVQEAMRSAIRSSAAVVDYADAMMETKLDLRAWAGVLGMSTTEFTKRIPGDHETKSLRLVSQPANQSC